MRVHLPFPSGHVNYDDEPICECGSVWSARVHDVPEVGDEAKALTERTLGETDTETVATQAN